MQDSNSETVFSKSLDELFKASDELAQFTVKTFKVGFKPPFEFREILKQAYAVGLNAIGLVSLTSFILGLVLVLQSRPALVQFGAGAYLPSMSSISIIREIGPLITALICAGKIGSGISAELGSMRVTEQIDAMEVSGTNPFRFLVTTRVLATTLMVPVLTIYADFVALIGAFIAANMKDVVNLTFFFNRIIQALEFSDVLPAFIKTFFFGFAIALVSCTKGFNSSKGTEGVGKATNSAVVISMLSVIVIDMVVTQLSAMLGYL